MAENSGGGNKKNSAFLRILIGAILVVCFYMLIGIGDFSAKMSFSDVFGLFGFFNFFFKLFGHDKNPGIFGVLIIVFFWGIIFLVIKTIIAGLYEYEREKRTAPVQKEQNVGIEKRRQRSSLSKTALLHICSLILLQILLFSSPIFRIQFGMLIALPISFAICFFTICSFAISVNRLSLLFETKPLNLFEKIVHELFYWKGRVERKRYFVISGGLIGILFTLILFFEILIGPGVYLLKQYPAISSIIKLLFPVTITAVYGLSLFLVPLSIISLAIVTVRRLHDLNLSGIYALMHIVIFFLMRFINQLRYNRQHAFGNIFIDFFIFQLGPNILLFFLLGIIKGSLGRNKYGDATVEEENGWKKGVKRNLLITGVFVFVIITSLTILTISNERITNKEIQYLTNMDKSANEFVQAFIMAHFTDDNNMNEMQNWLVPEYSQASMDELKRTIVVSKQKLGHWLNSRRRYDQSRNSSGFSSNPQGGGLYYAERIIQCNYKNGEATVCLTIIGSGETWKIKSVTFKIDKLYNPQNESESDQPGLNLSTSRGTSAEVKNITPIHRKNPASIKNDINAFIADLMNNVFREWKYESLMKYSTSSMAQGMQRNSERLKDKFELLIDKYGAIEDYTTEIKAVKEINSPYGIFLLSEDCAIQAEFENAEITIWLHMVCIGGKWQISSISFNGFNYSGLSKEEIWYRTEKNANRPVEEIIHN